MTGYRLNSSGTGPGEKLFLSLPAEDRQLVEAVKATGTGEPPDQAFIGAYQKLKEAGEDIGEHVKLSILSSSTNKKVDQWLIGCYGSPRELMWVTGTKPAIPIND